MDQLKFQSKILESESAKKTKENYSSYSGFYNKQKNLIQMELA
jgi:hypothetical protein